MAGVPLYSKILPNNNSTNTDKFRAYIRDNFEEIKSNCTIVSVTGRQTSRYRNNSHAMWIELGLDQKYCMIADYLNGIDGDSNLTDIKTLYLPETTYLQTICNRINR